MNSVYVPSGKAKEYGDYALNLFEGCPHGCVYCFAPSVLKKDRENFHANPKVRDGIVEATRKWFESKPEIKGKHIHLCFTCDPYPMNATPQMWWTVDKVVEIIHESGNFVQILTKGELKDHSWSLLKPGDIFGVTISCWNEIAETIEPNAAKPTDRLQMLEKAKALGLKTFVSCEPVFEAKTIYELIVECDFIDEYKIGKLNYMAKDNPLYPCINWGDFGKRCEELCIHSKRKYYIKEGLRKEMENG